MKRYLLSLSAVCLCLAGCSESTNESKTTGCDSATYQSVCLSQTSYLGCINGVIAQGNCSANQSCSNGSCISGASPAVCTSALRCEGNDLVSCYNGVDNRVTCPNGCENNACKTVTAGCTAGTRCEGASIVVCANNVETRVPCPNGCENGICKSSSSPCSPDGIRCDGKDLVSCSNGVESRQTCENGCANNACSSSTSCTTGISCDGNDLVICQNGSETRVSCPNGCEGGLCRSTSACSPDGVRCDGNDLVTCSGGKESRQTCNSGCVNDACVQTGCSPDGVRCDGNVLVTCKNGVETQQVCSNGCSNNACSPEAQECGNGKREGNEVCDGDDLGELTCHDVQGSVPAWVYTGKPECSSSCDDIVGPGTCERTFCGNNKLDTNELEFCDVVDGVAVFLNENISCDSLTGYGDRTWMPGGKPGCSADCKDLKKGTCVLEPQPQGGIETCQFVDLVKDESTKEVTAHARVIPVSGATQELISGRLACGDREYQTYTWTYSDARHMECADCAAGEYELVSEIDYSKKSPDTYDCVFQIFVDTSSLPGGTNSTSYYNCPVEYGYPHEQGIAGDEVIRTFTVDEPDLGGVLLAKWDFSGFTKFETAKSVKASDGVFASTSVISLSDGGDMTMFTNGDLSNMTASGTSWSTAATLSLESAKYFSLKTKTTGYKNIRLKYIVAGSSEKITKRIDTALNVLGIVKIVGTTLEFDDDRVFHEFPMTVLPDADAQNEIEIRIYPYNVESSTTVRVDDIYVIGDAI